MNYPHADRALAWLRARFVERSEWLPRELELAADAALIDWVEWHDSPEFLGAGLMLAVCEIRKGLWRSVYVLRPEETKP